MTHETTHPPSDRDEIAALLILLRRQPKGWAETVRRVLAARSARQVLDDVVGNAQPSLFDEPDSLDRDIEGARAELAVWQQEGLQVVCLLDDHYPERLHDMRQPPPLVFARGSFDELDATGVCVVGSRRADRAALRRAAAAARALSTAGRPVLSGLAAGVDTAALSAVREVQGRSIGVIGTGIRRYYPAENRPLQDHIAASGLLLSQFWPDAPPTKYSFPMRNELMSAWSAATYVVQADAKSGARMQARVALEQGRLLLLDSSLLDQGWVIDYAVREDVRVVSSPEDVVAAVSE